MKSGFLINLFGIYALSLLLVSAFNLAGERGDEDHENTSLLDAGNSDIFVNDAVIINKFNLEQNFGFEDGNIVEEEEEVQGSENEMTGSGGSSGSETQLKKQEIIIDAVSQNSGLLNEYTDTGQVLLTIVDSVNIELKNTAAEQAEQSQTTSEYNEKKVIINITTTTTTSPKQINLTEEEDEQQQHFGDIENITITEEKEDIPSFAEWAQKQLAEAEKKKEILNNSIQRENGASNNLLNQNGGGGGGNRKLRSKNYASPDCGAKIVAANSEATSPSSILSESKDEYMLNACTNRIWFIVELCEAVQVTRIELANFELFSSTPKNFTVQVSDRFPSRDWTIIGLFQAKDERNVQAYDFEQLNKFGKYVKIELLSYYGSEHFCPLSLFRLYGISEYEVLETEEEQNNNNDFIDDDEDDVIEYAATKNEVVAANNLFGSAKEAVMSFVKKAAQVLINKNQLINLNQLKNTTGCITPNYLIICDNCNELFFNEIYNLISCKYNLLQQLIKSKFITIIITQTNICLKYGLNFNSTINYNYNYNGINYFFNENYIVALCNLIAIREKKVFLNTTSTLNYNETIGGVITTDDTIQPTKTIEHHVVELETSELSNEIPEIQIQSTESVESSVVTEIVTTTTTTIVPPTPELIPPDEVVVSSELDSFENVVPELDSFLSEWEQSHVTTVPVTPPTTIPQGGGQKESVFVRLFNRIKALERNMSLSSQYLEELSRRYKKQMEEMQRAYDQTLELVNEKSEKNEHLQKQHTEFQQQMATQIKTLTTTVNTLLLERNSWSNAAAWFMHFLIIQLFLTTIILYFWNNKTDSPITPTPTKLQSMTSIVVPKRRKSLDIIRHESTSPKRRRRRPSEEALNITGTYNDLLIPDDDVVENVKKSDKRRKRKKQLRRCNSNSELLQKPIVVVKKFSDSGGDFRGGDNREFMSSATTSSAPMIQNPIFMKTAVSERGKRLSGTTVEGGVWNNGEVENVSSRTNSIIVSSLVESSQSLVLPPPEKKEKKKGGGGVGFKKILKKVF